MSAKELNPTSISQTEDFYKFPKKTESKIVPQSSSFNEVKSAMKS